MEQNYVSPQELPPVVCLILKDLHGHYFRLVNAQDASLPMKHTSDKRQKINRRVFDVGLYYLLPLLVRSELRLDSNGKARLQLERTDREYNVAFPYMVSKYMSLSTNYDSDYQWDAGLTLHY
ncbi:hypothetical protein [Hymenobacter psychrotolerans]|uniref:Uncharacterized protein n=1 Tax=Hymenobacter psychrotolerans DSM 18569 TaxID=1121959 RepID=A0A1M7H158_9BACT|nr:hypothetical protein [Hymenobacter psychrotolerans]SHM22076.1 hypothetical protein SAMN02746009_04139 [Hymenobacter psychrotolerans DSM 18569]